MTDFIQGLLGIVIILVVIFVIYKLFRHFLTGALYLWKLAQEAGFIGIALYLACWFFMCPLMVVCCIASGFLKKRDDRENASSS